MQNFPSKWFEFSNYKELKRLRNDINNTLGLKLQIASSIIIAIVSFFLESFYQNCKPWVQFILCALLCLAVALIFVAPTIWAHIEMQRRCNVMIKGKDAINIFDDEIIYNVLVAYEYQNIRNELQNNADTVNLRRFFNIEIAYYVGESIKTLYKFMANAGRIFGDKENQISSERANNICCIINTLLNDSEITIPSELVDEFLDFDRMIKEKIRNDSWKNRY